MKTHILLAFCLMSLPATLPAAALPAAALPAAQDSAERLGTVSFAVSCAPAVHKSFVRGVALLHDFWYQEAQRQFEEIANADPSCAMAHWGAAMSLYHQIWDRPDAATVAKGWQEMQAARARPAKTARERAYVAALSDFYEPGPRDYQARVEAYAAAMGKLYQDYPKDTDAGAFYALALLASQAPNDDSLTLNRKAMAVLTPLFAQYPDHPGVVHYIIHACDTPALAQDGLAAARHYGEIAASAPHAVHMPGHIFARLGMWQADIDANLASVAASHAAESRKQSGAMDQFHSDDFLVYAYLQSGQEARAKAVLNDSAAAIAHFETMSDMGDHYMTGMFPYYRTKLPIFYNLELRDWKTAAALQAVAGAPPESQTLTYWARTVAAGHLHQAQQAQADLSGYDALMAKIKQGRHAYFAGSTGARIQRGEMLAWIAFAQNNPADALERMQEAADLQDKVGQGEVDIPAREMLADILLELGRPQDALAEYKKALALSPNRFNGLFNAGRAAEEVGDAPQAQRYYATLLKITDNGSQSARPEFDHVRRVVSSAKLAVK
ncbi:MAG TPA: tetratricopeptide repeat protein [Steroidobacteraceae bacterium]